MSAVKCAVTSHWGIGQLPHLRQSRADYGRPVRGQPAPDGAFRIQRARKKTGAADAAVAKQPLETARIGKDGRRRMQPKKKTEGVCNFSCSLLFSVCGLESCHVEDVAGRGCDLLCGRRVRHDGRGADQRNMT